MEFTFIYPIRVTDDGGTDFTAAEIEMRADLIPSQYDPEEWSVDCLYAANLDARLNDWTPVKPGTRTYEQAIRFMQRDGDTSRRLEDEWGEYLFDNVAPRARIIAGNEHSTHWGQP